MGPDAGPQATGSQRAPRQHREALAWNLAVLLTDTRSESTKEKKLQVTEGGMARTPSAPALSVWGNGVVTADLQIPVVEIKASKSRCLSGFSRERTRGKGWR